jgi:hypothetical protein
VTTVGLTYCGWGYEPGQYGAVVNVFAASDGRVLGVANARMEPDEDGMYGVEWDRVGALPASCADLPWPPPRDLALTDLTDDEQDTYYDELRDALREVLRD